MLRRFAYNKIFRTTGMLLLLFLLIVFPTGKKYSLSTTNTKKVLAQQLKDEAYLLDKNNFVARCKVNIEGDSKEDKARFLIELMIIDGKYIENIPNGFKPILPLDTKINALVVDGNNVTIDLSNDFYLLKKDNEMKAIEMLTFNLTSIDNVKNVYINIDGKKLNVLPNSKTNIKQPLTRQIGINKSIHVTNYKDVKNTIIYFVNKSNTDFYYVPVTKVNNDNREKIQIIVDELTSSHIYETNLMSFLNYNTKLINYELDEKQLILNFNKYLFDDASASTILEEVIYSISLSVRENYDVKEVIFNVDGKEITKSVIKNIE